MDLKDKTDMIDTFQDDTIDNFFDQYEKDFEQNEIQNIFQFKETIRQFIIDMLPIFESGIRTITQPGVFIDNQLPQMIKATLLLSNKIANLCLDRKPFKEEIKTFRQISANIIAEIVLSNNDDFLEEIDLDSIAEEIVKSFQLIPYKDIHKENNKCAYNSYTSSNILVIGEIVKLITVYDFRKPKREMLNQLIEIVFHAIDKCVKKIVPHSTEIKEYEDIYYSIATSMSKMMSAAYEKHTYDFLNFLKQRKINEEEILLLCEKHNPIEEITDIFEEYTELLSEQIFFYGKSLTELNNKK